MISEIRVYSPPNDTVSHSHGRYLHVSGGTFVRVPEANQKKVNIVGFFGLASWDAQQKVQNRNMTPMALAVGCKQKIVKGGRPLNEKD